MNAPTIFAVVIFLVIASLIVMAIVSLFSTRHATAKADGADDEQTPPSPAPPRSDTMPPPQADRPGDGQRPPSVPTPQADRPGDGQRPRTLRRPKPDRRDGPPQVQLPADATVTFATEREAAAIGPYFRWPGS